jgi:hypothetical protein
VAILASYGSGTQSWLATLDEGSLNTSVLETAQKVNTIRPVTTAVTVAVTIQGRSFAILCVERPANRVGIQVPGTLDSPRPASQEIPRKLRVHSHRTPRVAGTFVRVRFAGERRKGGCETERTHHLTEGCQLG